MKHGVVHPEIPRYQWSEHTNAGRVALAALDPSQIQHGEDQTEIFPEDIGFRNRVEAPLQGPPHRAKESVLLSSDGIANASTIVTEAIGLKSGDYRLLVDRTVNLLAGQPALARIVLDGLGTLTDPDIVSGHRVRTEAARLKDKLDERRYQAGHDILSPTMDTKTVKRDSVDAIVDLFIDYRALQPKEKQERAQELARQMIANPQETRHTFETFTLLESANIFSPSGLETMQEYAGEAENAVDTLLEQGNLPEITPAGMEHWVIDWANGKNERSNTVIRTLIAQAETPVQITNVMYDIILAAVASGERVAIQSAMELATSARDELPLESNQTADLFAARLNEDIAIQDKALEIYDAILAAATQLFDVNNPNEEAFQASMDLANNLRRQTRFVNASERYKNEVIRIGVDFPAQYERAVKILQKTNNSERLEVTGLAKRMRVLRARAKAINATRTGNAARLLDANHDVGPLGEWTRDNFSELGTQASWRRSNTKLHAHLNLPGHPVEVVETTRSKASQTVYDLLHQATFDQPIEKATHWNTLGFLIPQHLTLKDFSRFTHETAALKQEMMYEKIHSLSPRGDHVTISNEALQQLGFESITYMMHPARKDFTIVTLRAGNAAFRCYLDRDYKLREMNTGHGMGIEATAPFLEYVAVSHLHQIHCTENEELPDDLPQNAETQTTEYRRAHRRILPLGQSPSQDQIVKAWDEYGIDLIKQNKHRLENGQTQLITWVSQVKPEHVAGRSPVHSKGDIAGARLVDLLV